MKIRPPPVSEADCFTQPEPGPALIVGQWGWGRPVGMGQVLRFVMNMTAGEYRA